MTALLPINEITSIGVESIDDDHQQLLALIKQLNSAVEGADVARTQMLLDIIGRELAEHFHEEEQMLERHNYPQFQEHVHGHTESLILLERLMRSDDLPSTEQVAEFIHHFLDSTCRADLDVKWFFLDRGVAPGKA